MGHKVLAINPGSTSTKVGLFNGEEALLSLNVAHDAEKLANYPTLPDQLDYRRETISKMLEEHDVDLKQIDAFVGRGGGLLPLVGGVYIVGDTMLDHAIRGANGVQHPANLGSLLAHEYAVANDKPAFVVNPPDVDEFCDLARMTGIEGVYRTCHLHALNLKETAIRYASSIGKRYDELKLIVCHIGGGTSISAHCRGRMIDGNDIVGGDGPMTPTRCGSVPVAGVLAYLADHEASQLRALSMKNGGFVNHLGTSDAREVSARAQAGDARAQRVWDSMVYQICKYIGEMACALEGDVDAILLGGGLVHNEALVEGIRARCEWIAPIQATPGEFELEAMAAGANRVLDGVEEPLEYTGVPRWTGFE